MAEVQRTTTPLARAELAQALIAGHRRYFGTLPNENRLAVAWAHCALEHAAGAKLYNFNLGNVTCGPSWEGDFYVMHVPPPDPPVLRFRAFESAELGAVDYWRMLDTHYPSALALFDKGSAYDAAFRLGQIGYYTAKKEVYSNAVANWKSWYVRELAATFVEPLSEGQGNSLLTQHEIDQTLASIEPSNGQRIDDQILSDQDERERPTDPDLGTIPPPDDEAPGGTS